MAYRYHEQRGRHSIIHNFQLNQLVPSHHRWESIICAAKCYVSVCHREIKICSNIRS